MGGEYRGVEEGSDNPGSLPWGHKAIRAVSLKAAMQLGG